MQGNTCPYRLQRRLGRTEHAPREHRVIDRLAAGGVEHHVLRACAGSGLWSGIVNLRGALAWLSLRTRASSAAETVIQQICGPRAPLRSASWRGPATLAARSRRSPCVEGTRGLCGRVSLVAMRALVWHGPAQMSMGYLGWQANRAPPLVMGHEFAGRVIAAGEGVEPEWCGRRAAVNPLVPGEDATAGIEQLSRGGRSPARSRSRSANHQLLELHPLLDHGGTAPAFQ